jgi:DNA-binding transcriptional MocR family regulator
MKLYENLAQELSQRIENGYFQPGDKLPSIRQMSQEHAVSISTVQEAYRLLEDNGSVEVRPKSGYYILGRKTVPNLPKISRPTIKPIAVSRWEMVVQLLHSHESDGRLALGKGTPDLSADTLKPLFKLTSDISRRSDISLLTYDSLQGCLELRYQIARVMMDSGCHLHPDDIVLTTGCQEGLTCSMRSVTQSGDIIAIESPSYYGSMQTIQALDLKALEIPTHPETGISIEAFEMALEQWPIKVLQVTPICNNPLGYTMPDANKQRLVELANQHDIAIIEDDIYGDLSYTYPRPRTIKSFDTEGRVILCSSFSKTISPAFRTGWCVPGRYLEQVKHMKYVSTACGSVLQPRAIAEYIAQGYYEKHVRKMRTQYLRSRDHMLEWASRYFPEKTLMSYPQGGFLLWIEFPKGIDTTELNTCLAEKNISIAPGTLFTASKKFTNCLRLNYTSTDQKEIQTALKIIGEEACRLLDTQ